ncbi:MAG: hypothetical protein QXP42_05070 [Candidatus Micrarchaeia archaeon]
MIQKQMETRREELKNWFNEKGRRYGETPEKALGNWAVYALSRGHATSQEIERVYKEYGVKMPKEVIALVRAKEVRSWLAAGLSEVNKVLVR